MDPFSGQDPFKGDPFTSSNKEAAQVRGWEGRQGKKEGRMEGARGEGRMEAGRGEGGNRDGGETEE